MQQERKINVFSEIQFSGASLAWVFFINFLPSPINYGSLREKKSLARVANLIRNSFGNFREWKTPTETMRIMKENTRSIKRLKLNNFSNTYYSSTVLRRCNSQLKTKSGASLPEVPPRCLAASNLPAVQMRRAVVTANLTNRRLLK